MDRLIIKKVKEHKFLYDDQQKFYRDTEKRLQTWEKIGRDLKIRGEEARCIWDKIRRCYINARNRRRLKEYESGQKIHPWKYETEMAFLLPFVQKKRKTFDPSFDESNENNDSMSQHNSDDQSFDLCQKMIESENENLIKPELNETTEPEVLCYEYSQSEQELHHDADPDPDDENEDQNRSFKINHKRSYHDDNDNYDEGDDGGQAEVRSPRKKLVRRSNSLLEMDEDDMFFMSMSQMTKSLPTILERAKVKLAVSNAVLQALINANLVPTIPYPAPVQLNGVTLEPSAGSEAAT